MMLARLYVETPADALARWMLVCFDGLVRSWCEYLPLPIRRWVP
jgi:hypothetical protein